MFVTRLEPTRCLTKQLTNSVNKVLLDIIVPLLVDKFWALIRFNTNIKEDICTSFLFHICFSCCLTTELFLLDFI